MQILSLWFFCVGLTCAWGAGESERLADPPLGQQVRSEVILQHPASKTEESVARTELPSVPSIREPIQDAGKVVDLMDFVRRHVDNLPLITRSLWWREKLGILAGTTTQAFTKIVSGVTFVCASSLVLSVYTWNACGYHFLPSNTTLEEMTNSSLALNFARTRPSCSYNQTTNTTNCGYLVPQLCDGLSNTVVVGSVSGIVIGGFLLISGIADFCIAGYDSSSSLDTFESLILESLKEHEREGKRELDRAEMLKFLNFAKGEWLDLFQERGAFNTAKFKSSLLKWSSS